jgi:uncharacterized protein (DUF885 family)
MRLAAAALAGALFLVSMSCRDAPEAPDLAAAAARVRALADEFWAAYVERYPEVATAQGVTQAPHDRLTDHSLDALAAWRAREDAWLAELRALGPAILPAAAASTPGPPEQLLYETLLQALESAAGTRVCRSELWNVSEVAGWQQGFADVAAAQPVGTPEARRNAVARWRALPRLVDTEIANAREGLKQGTTAWRGTVRLVIAQADALLAQPAAGSPFLEPATRDADPGFRRDLETALKEEIHPALRRYRDFLEKEYLPAARESIAVSANPEGAACYDAASHAFTTLRLSARDIHEIGLQEMARIEAEMKAIAERSFRTSDVPALLARLRTDPEYMFKSREEMIAYAEAAVARARAAMPRWFGIVPAAEVVIRPQPSYREPTADQYNAPAEDGSRPGVYLISTHEPRTRSRCGPESTTFHETIPGHHLQSAIAQERKGSHPLQRFDIYLPGGRYNGAYSEGWALYAERLADEMGLFSSDLDRLGMLSQLAWRAARLVVDPGMHVLGWSRQQAIDYLQSHTAGAPSEVESEIDRYIAWPGQATGYMVGALEIRRLREEAERRLGPRFDIRRFHDRVLEDGGLPMAALRRKIERWVEAGSPGEAQP